MGKTWKYICKGSHFVEENAQVKVSAIIVAAGASRRMGFDKLSYRLPGGKTVLETSVAAFAAHPSKSGVKPRYHREHFFQHIAIYPLVRFDVLRLALECLFAERPAVETHIVEV